MERKIKTHGEHLKQVLLYRDDIEHIIELLREVSPNVELSTDEHKFSDVKEWAEVKRDYFTNLQIATRNPYVSLDLSERSVWLYIAEDTPQSRGVFEKIKRFLMNRKHPRQWLLNFWMPNLVLYIWIFLFNLALWGRIPFWGSKSTVWTVSGICFLGYAYWWWLTFRAQTRRYSIIVPKYRVDAPRFWKRNADKIVVAIIAAIFGSLLTLLIKALTAKGP